MFMDLLSCCFVNHLRALLIIALINMSLKTFSTICQPNKYENGIIVSYNVYLGDSIVEAIFRLNLSP